MAHGLLRSREGAVLDSCPAVQCMEFTKQKKNKKQTNKEELIELLRTMKDLLNSLIQIWKGRRGRLVYASAAVPSLQDVSCATVGEYAKSEKNGRSPSYQT